MSIRSAINSDQSPANEAVEKVRINEEHAKLGVAKMIPQSEIVALNRNMEVAFLVNFFTLTFSTGSTRWRTLRRNIARQFVIDNTRESFHRLGARN
jgi:hypothetical protein